MNRDILRGYCAHTHRGHFCTEPPNHPGDHHAHSRDGHTLHTWPNTAVQHHPELGATYTPNQPDGYVLWIGGIGYHHTELPALINLAQTAHRDSRELQP